MLYYFVLQIHAELLNQGSSHLSTDQIPIPTNYIVTLVVWMVLSFLWLVNALCFRRVSASVSEDAICSTGRLSLGRIHVVHIERVICKLCYSKFNADIATNVLGGYLI